MILKKLRNRRGESRLDQAARMCLPAAVFQRVLERERMRSDRNGVAFALIVISPPANRLSAFQRLDASLAERLRATDVTGYLNDQQLAVLLTATDHDGAKAFIEAIAADGDMSEEVDVCVYVYPALPDQVLVVPQVPTSADHPQHDRDDNPDDDPAPPRRAQPLFAHALPIWKRTIDIVASSLGMIMLAPVFAVVAVAIKVTSPGPVFFRQSRSGQGGVPFVMVKFRTMCANAEERKVELLDQNEQDGPAFKVECDPRITRIGGYLRRTCLDELPQLWNVLRGEMTLVGPRPLPCDEASQCVGWQRRRLDLVPGLTCFWQVDGSRDDFSEWMRMDIRYAGQARFSVDVKLLWRTFLKVVLHRASC